MSYKVSNYVAEVSGADSNARLLLYSLAEIAHHDGVGWASIDFADDDPGWKKKASLRWRMGKPDEKTVRNAIERAQELDELEVVIAYDGRRRFHIYRILIGSLRDVPVDYSRGLPRLASPFWTPDELLEEKEQRRADGHKLPWTRVSRVGKSPTRQTVDLASDGWESDPLTGGNGARRRVGAGAHPYSSLDHVQDSPSTTSPSKNEGEVVPAAAGRRPNEPLRKQLLRAFAEELGVWPERGNRDQWGAWCRAFKQLAEREQPSVDELRLVTRAYLARWPHAPADMAAMPFALEKVWQRISASLIASYLAFYRWTTDTSWRLPADEAEWILETATRLKPAERDELRELAARVRAAHVDAGSELLRWVEHDGWALDDEPWRHELVLRTPETLGTRRPELRRSAIKRRLEIRADLAAARSDVV